MEESPPLTVGVPRERVLGERRVALVPDAAGELTRAGFRVLVETGAGAGAYFDDQAYRDAGADIAATPEAAFGADIVAKVQPPLIDEIALFRPGALLLSFLETRRDA